ncbi:hypothetical protein DCAR_0935383 [Daucus carota subsp. sativus]|uniref:3'-5' exonuclease domain-containing protein n=1 Tax=Daucus carota subsp. sativus TaxID=79200 RepID=A0A175YI62_DAUCS|nr:hypothetical protein DCAR_0935383 [Daucus carota subsp. sativus]
MRNVRIKPTFADRRYRRRTFTVKCHDRVILTTVTSTPAVVRSWLHRVISSFIHHFRARRLVVGLGVQWREDCSQAATLQLCVGRFCLIFQLLYARNVPRSLRRFLSNPNITFVGVGNSRDRGMLSRSRHEIDVDQLVDARYVAAERRNISVRVSMERLAEMILGMSGLDKPEEIGRSNWNVSLLSHKQVVYACVDAFVSFCLGRDLDAWDWNRYITSLFISRYLYANICCLFFDV